MSPLISFMRNIFMTTVFMTNTVESVLQINVMLLNNPGHRTEMLIVRENIKQFFCNYSTIFSATFCNFPHFFHNFFTNISSTFISH